MSIDDTRRIAGEPCWLELGGPARPEVLDFWAEALGWEFDHNERVDGYVRGHAGGRKVAGFGGPLEPTTPRGWRVYLHVDDLPALLVIAVAGGASVVHPVTAAGPDGRFAFVRDPFGTVTGLFEPNDDPGTSRERGPGRIARWCLAVSDVEGVRAFYASLLPGFADHVDVVAGESGWGAIVTAPAGGRTGEITDPAGNTLTVARVTAPVVVS